MARGALKPLRLRYLLEFTLIPSSALEAKLFKRDVALIIKSMCDAAEMVEKVKIVIKKLARK